MANPEVKAQVPPAPQGDDPTKDTQSNKPGEKPDQPGSHPLIARHVAHLTKPQNLVTLVGYLGPSSRPGFVRFYRDLDARSYLEVPEGKILSRFVSDPSDESLPSKIVIDESEDLEFVQILKPTFLQARGFTIESTGAIKDRFLLRPKDKGTGVPIPMTQFPCDDGPSTQLCW